MVVIYDNNYPASKYIDILCHWYAAIYDVWDAKRAAQNPIFWSGLGLPLFR
jgi:hypothetical protein